jgi:hypothetical protein
MAIPNPNSTVRSSSAGHPLGLDRHYDFLQRESELHRNTRVSSLVFVAKILEINQQLGCYLVSVQGMPHMLAVPLSPMGVGLGCGVGSIPMYGVGSTVMVLHTPELGPGRAVILGRLPDPMGSTVLPSIPELFPGSPAGSYKDAISDQGQLNSPLVNFNNGHMLDAYAGDHQAVNMLGCGLVVGALHASLISGYGCSVECHYIDDLVRLNSYNFEQTTAGSETLMFADGGDYTEVRRRNPYVLESLGAPYQYGALPLKKGTPRGPDSQEQDDTGAYALQEPEQQGWWRRLDFDGFLPNLSSTYVAVPSLTAVRSAAKAEEPDEAGVFRQHLDATGAYTVVSAKSIALVKDCLIPVPRELKRPDDSRGAKSVTLEADREATVPELADYEIEGAEENLDGAALAYAASSSDSIAFRNHRATVNFKVRKDDWTIWSMEEVDLAGLKPGIDSSGMLPASENVSEERMHARLPKVALLRISEGQDARYYASRSMVLLNDDGSIHLQDGYGGCISMRAGSIDISCPGDITLRPGRNLAVVAGASVSCVGGVDVELAATQGDVRIHADRNVSVLSGNDGAGGILLETKAQGSILSGQNESGSPRFKAPGSNANAYGGVWIKAKESGFYAVGREIYSGNASEAASIRLDSGSGTLTAAGTQAVFEAATTTFISDRTKPEASTSMSLTQAGVYMKSRGSFFFEGQSILAAGANSSTISLQVRGSAVFSESVLSGSGFGGPSQFVSPLDANSISTTLDAVTRGISGQQTSLGQITAAAAASGKDFDKSVLKTSRSSLANLTFCYPDSPDRGIPDSTQYALLESEWQQQYRLQGAGTAMILRGVDPSRPAGAAPQGVSEASTYFWPGARALAGKFAQLQAGEGRLVDEKLRLKSEGFGQALAPIGAPSTFEGAYTIPARNQVRSTT